MKGRTGSSFILEHYLSSLTLALISGKSFKLCQIERKIELCGRYIALQDAYRSDEALVPWCYCKSLGKRNIKGSIRRNYTGNSSLLAGAQGLCIPFSGKGGKRKTSRYRISSKGKSFLKYTGIAS